MTNNLVEILENLTRRTLAGELQWTRVTGQPLGIRMESFSTGWSEHWSVSLSGGWYYSSYSSQSPLLIGPNGERFFYRDNPVSEWMTLFNAIERQVDAWRTSGHSGRCK